MFRSRKRLGYLLAIAGCGLVLIGRMALEGVLAEQARLLPFVLAVMAAAWWGGWGPGVFATMFGTFLGLWFIVPPSSSLLVESLADGVNAVIFVLTGLTISGLCEALHQAQRRETEKQFHMLADTMPQLVWMARPDGYRFWFNRRWFEYTGAPASGLVGLDWSRYCRADDAPRIVASWQAAAAAGQTWEETYPLRRHDGEYRWHLARAVPIVDNQGKIVRWFGTSTDIQERMQFEKALKDADAQKDQFLATLAHELRNPLAPIRNALELWPYVAGDRAELEHVRAIVDRQSLQLVRLIDDLMDLARVTQGKIALRREHIDLRHAVESAVETSQPLVEGGAHRLTVALPNEPIVVDGDMARLTQVFSNLLNNAAKYTVRNGQVTISLAVEAEQAVVRVCDNGPGIPPAMLERIFEAFRQVDSTLGRSHGGLGIGLWLARQLVELHGGRIAATSEGTGRGSEFVVRLPLAVTGDVQPAASLPQETQADVADPRDVLVVDDVRESADTLVMVLEWLGHRAVAAHDGPSAIEHVLAHRPEIVLLDIAMPGLDGYEVARQLRTHAQLDDTMLVALTGLGQSEDRRRALDAGFDAHLTKPTSISSLRKLLAELPYRRHTAGASTD